MRVLVIALLSTSANAFLAGRQPGSFLGVKARLLPVLKASLDYTDPVVSEELVKLQGLPTEDVEDELANLGVRAPPGMDDMSIRLMLVEMKLRVSGRMTGMKKEAKVKKTTFGNDFERAMYEKPAFKQLYEKYSNAYNTNAINVITEYMVDREQATVRSFR